MSFYYWCGCLYKCWFLTISNNTEVKEPFKNEIAEIAFFIATSHETVVKKTEYGYRSWDLKHLFLTPFNVDSEQQYFFKKSENVFCHLIL